MAASNDIENVLKEFGLNIVKDSRSSLKKKLDERAAKHNGKSVKSRLEASIRSEVGYKNGAIVLSIKMNDYWDIVDGGRRAAPVSSDGQRKIAEWSKTRGVAEKLRVADLQLRQAKQKESKTDRKKKKLTKMPFERAAKSAAFLIARKLKNKALEPTHFFTEVINDGRIDELKTKLKEIIKTDIELNIYQ